ncbi:sensor histidine kinase [Ornithinimicrobium sediminis]|uniref:sensor histidine kinase n=1 Tax=Ornithinimicrobium sediminis TaxID=2904603 RepID=UPI001E5CCCA5|nr:histidine kinase [Ornithinimicrobium sediminis]
MSRSVPATTAWGETWRLGLAALLGAVSFVVVLALASYDELGDFPAWWPWVDPLAGVLAVTLLLWRRRRPVPVVLAATLCTMVSLSAAPAAALALISLATRRRWRELALVLPVWLVASVPSEWFIPDGTEPSLLAALTTQVATFVGLTGLGAAIGAQRDTLVALRQRAETAEREQAGRIAQAQSAERARIAREMHDVLAHRISMIAMHAGALAYREDLPRQQVRQTAELLRDNADLAVSELREILGVLRGEGEPEQPSGPQPDLAALPSLVEEVRDNGTEVDLTIDLPDPAGLGGVPARMSRHAYRVVQEALTNARKHAPGVPVTVELVGDPEQGLRFLVMNEPAPYGGVVPAPESSGVGLIGLRERVTLAGGQLAYGPDRAGRFVVHGSLPWQE